MADQEDSPVLKNARILTEMLELRWLIMLSRHLTELNGELVELVLMSDASLKS